MVYLLLVNQGKLRIGDQVCHLKGTGFIYPSRYTSGHLLVRHPILKWIAKLDRMLYAYLVVSIATPEALARACHDPSTWLSGTKDHL